MTWVSEKLPSNGVDFKTLKTHSSYHTHTFKLQMAELTWIEMAVFLLKIC